MKRLNRTSAGVMTGRNSALEPLWNTIHDTVCGTLAQGTELDFRFLLPVRCMQNIGAGFGAT
ncbi:hypothetical protein [Pseudomonas sp. CLCA07]